MNDSLRLIQEALLSLPLSAWMLLLSLPVWLAVLAISAGRRKS